MPIWAAVKAYSQVFSSPGPCILYLFFLGGMALNSKAGSIIWGHVARKFYGENLNSETVVRHLGRTDVH